MIMMRVPLQVALLLLAATMGCDAFSTPVQTSSQVVYHINTTITPARCGETTIAGKTAFIQYALISWTNYAPGSRDARLNRKYLQKGTCAGVGFTVLWDSAMDVSSHQTFTANTTGTKAHGLRYSYDVKFFRKPSRKELLSQGLAATVYHINTNVNPPRCGEAIVLNKNLDTALKWLGSVQAGSSVHGTTQPADVVPLRLGTCAEAGYGTPAGPQEDVSAEQTFRYSIYSYGPYDITFYTKGGKVVDTSVVGLAAKNPRLSMFGAAVKAAGLGAALSAPGALTIFVPTNSAFKALGSVVSTLLEPRNKALLAKVLKYHVVKGAIQTDFFTQDLKIATLEGQDLHFAEKNGHLQVNDADIVGGDMRASDDIVHVIDKVLLYPGFSLPTADSSSGDAVSVGGSSDDASSDDASFGGQ